MTERNREAMRIAIERMRRTVDRMRAELDEAARPHPDAGVSEAQRGAGAESRAEG